MSSIHPDCEKCGKIVYPAELQSMEKRVFHHGCLRCEESSCNKILGGNNWGGFLDDEAYCKIHLNRVAQATGRSTSSTKKWTPKPQDPNKPKTASRFGSGNFEKCKGCGKTVYPAEKMSMEGRVYHSGGCLRCVECSVKLGGANWGGFIPRDSDTAYCKVHRDQHLAKTGGAGLATTNWVPKASSGSEKRSSRFGGGNHEKCTGCGKTVYPAERQSMEGHTYHPGCLRCTECNVKLGGANWGGYIPTDSTTAYCKVHRDQHLAKTGGATKVKWEKKENTGEKRSSKFGSIPRDKCEVCGKTVYPAEKLSLEKKIYHNGCVRCTECNKSVTGANFGNILADGTAYCKVHYDRLIASVGDSTKISGSQGNWNNEDEQ